MPLKRKRRIDEWRAHSAGVGAATAEEAARVRPRKKVSEGVKSMASDEGEKGGGRPKD